MNTPWIKSRAARLLAIASTALAACASEPEPSTQNPPDQLEVRTQALIGGAKTISKNYTAPLGIQGVKDGGFVWNNGSFPFEDRYQTLGVNGWGAAVAHASLGWSDVDLIDRICPPGVSDATCTAELATRCPHALTQIGTKKYCFAQLKDSFLDGYDDMNAGASDSIVQTIKSHTQAGIQTVYNVDGTPRRYAYAECLNEGLTGCVPRTDALQHLSAFVQYVAARFNCPKGSTSCTSNGRPTSVGKVSHFIVGNEVSESQYFNVRGLPRGDGTKIDTRKVDVTNSDRNRWASHYASVVRAVHDGIARAGRTDVMLWASLAATFGTDTFHGSGWSISNQRILDALKYDLNTAVDWSIVVHPYGDPSADPDVANPGWLVVENVAAISRQMTNWLRSLGATDPLGHPQSRIFLAEQSYSVLFPGVNPIPSYRRDREKVAEWMCRAHHYAVRNPNIMLVTHEHFQCDSNEWNIEKQGLPPASGNLEHYGLIPWDERYDTATNLLLTRANELKEGRIYRSTFSNGDFGKNDTNTCCTDYGMGCVSAPSVTGRVVRLEESALEVSLVGWACSPKTRAPLYVEARSGPYLNNPVAIKRVRADRAPEAGISPQCAPGSVAHGFRIPFTRQEMTTYRGELSVWAFDLNGRAFVLPSEGWHMPAVPADFHAVRGWVDGVAKDTNLYSIKGWACAQGSTDQVIVEIRVGPFPGTTIKNARANLLNEPAVTSLCGGYGANYRFEVPFTRAEVAAYADRQLIVHAVSPDGGASVFLPANDYIAMPLLTSSYQVAGSLNGRVEALQPWEHRYTLTGWACAHGNRNSIRVHAYSGPWNAASVCGANAPAPLPATCKAFIKEVTANLPTEPGLQTLCGGDGQSAYRFEIPFSAADVARHTGRSLAVFALSPTGGPNIVLPRPLDFTMPALPAGY